MNVEEGLKNHRIWLETSGEQGARFTTIGSHSGANLSGASLSLANFKDANLSLANLSDADLSGANLSGANLSGTNLSDAYLNGANLNGANLNGANLNGANLSGANLNGANLSNTDLSFADLSFADLSFANLRDTDLSNADLSFANLSNADLWSANLRKANLSNANLRKANLSNANLCGTNFSNANLSNANLRDANPSDADLNDTDINDADLCTDFSNANLSNANLSNVNLSDANLSAAILIKADLSDADLWSADFSNANLSNANLSDADLGDANLSNANLSNANLSDANLSDANLNNANLNNANLRSADLSGSKLSGVDLSGVQALQTNFNSAVLTGACIEDWNINSKTELESIVCQTIYLRMNWDSGKYTDRRPSNEDAFFDDGDFARLVRKAQDTVDLIFRNGIDWKALAISMERFKVESDGAELTIQAIENKGEDDFVIKVNVPADANKSELEKFLKHEYELARNALEAQYRSQLEAKDREIEIHRQQNTDLTEIMKLMASKPINIVNTARSESNSVSDNISINQSGAINPNASVAKDNARIQNILHNYPAEQQKSLAEAAAEIQQLLEQLSETYPTTTIAEKSALATKAIETIEKDPAQKAKIVKALKAGGIALLKELVEPVMKPITNILFPMLEELTKD